MQRSRQNELRSKLPFVLVNMAMTADGKIATADRSISAFSSRYDQMHLLRLRAQADAVIVGARTADSALVTLGPGPARFKRLRLKHGLAEYNLRVIVSGAGSVNPDAEVFKHRFSPIIVITSARASKRRIKRLEALADAVRICGASEIDFPEALRYLGQEWNVRRLLCEGGGRLNSALFEAGLVDELHLTICPKIFGGRLAPTIADGRGALALADAANLALKSARRVGDELFLVYNAKTKS